MKYIIIQKTTGDFTINDVLIDTKTYEKLGYQIVERESEIDNLIKWIAESKSESDIFLMKEDLQMLMNNEDRFIFSSLSTNEYHTENEDYFNDLCKQLLTLNQ